MGLLDDLLRQVGIVSGGTRQSADASGVFAMLNDALASHGGVQGLVNSFRQGDLADAVNSWIGTGANISVTPDQIQKALGSERLSQIAQQLGVPARDAAATLASSLPTLIDGATPNGTLSGPAGDLMGSAFGFQKKSLQE